MRLYLGKKGEEVVAGEGFDVVKAIIFFVVAVIGIGLLVGNWNALIVGIRNFFRFGG